MFYDQLEAAIAFYTATFPNSEVCNVARMGEDGPISLAPRASCRGHSSLVEW